MGLFDGLRKKGRPRESFTLEESRLILAETIGRMVHTRIDWETHRKISETVFSICVESISLYALELMLKHKNVRDVYFNPKPFDTGKLVLKMVYR
jgi:hypothetical protein